MKKFFAHFLTLCLVVEALLLNPGFARNPPNQGRYYCCCGQHDYQFCSCCWPNRFADVFITRPLQVATAVLGLGSFIGTFPLSVLNHTTYRAGQDLVEEPLRAAFQRPIGCAPDDYKRDFVRNGGCINCQYYNY